MPSYPIIENIHIKDAVVFSEVNLELKQGLNVFSGASGSGKSVFMQALLALFGIKESNAASIQSSINFSQIPFEDYGLEPQEEWIIRVVKKDKMRFFSNGDLIAKKTLTALLSPIVKYISLKNAVELLDENVLRVFDLFISSKDPQHQEVLLEMNDNFQAFSRIQKAYEKLLQDKERLNDLREMAEFEIHKINQIQPKIGEYEELLLLKKNLSKKEKNKEILEKALQAFENLQPIHQAIRQLEIMCPQFDEAIYEIQNKLEEEEQKLQELDCVQPETLLQRISQLSDLNHRYGSIENAIAHLEKQQAKLKEYENFDIQETELQKEKIRLKSCCVKLSEKLQQNREKYMKDFLKEIQSFCNLLRLRDPKAELISIPLCATGNKKLVLTLKDTAIDSLSTGEYNRLRLIMMCIEAKVSEKSGILVLDEIDANLSGEESEGVAKILHLLSKTYQIFAISHQPHIPALADTHYLVYQVDGKSEIKELDQEGKIYEIARMISGSEITQEALDFAKKRLEDARCET